MDRMKRLAVAVLAVAGLSGCASTGVADLARTDAAPVQAEESKVSRALPGYVSRGGYRMRRLAAVAATG